MTLGKPQRAYLPTAGAECTAVRVSSKAHPRPSSPLWQWRPLCSAALPEPVQLRGHTLTPHRVQGLPHRARLVGVGVSEACSNCPSLSPAGCHTSSEGPAGHHLFLLSVWSSLTLLFSPCPARHSPLLPHPPPVFDSQQLCSWGQGGCGYL